MLKHARHGTFTFGKIYDVSVPADRGCRPKVYRGTSSLGFAYGLFRISFGFRRFYHGFNKILLSRLS